MVKKIKALPFFNAVIAIHISPLRVLSLETIAGHDTVILHCSITLLLLLIPNQTAVNLGEALHTFNTTILIPMHTFLRWLLSPTHSPNTY